MTGSSVTCTRPPVPRHRGVRGAAPAAVRGARHHHDRRAPGRRSRSSPAALSTDSGTHSVTAASRCPRPRPTSCPGVCCSAARNCTTTTTPFRVRRALPCSAGRSTSAGCGSGCSEAWVWRACAGTRRGRIRRRARRELDDETLNALFTHRMHVLRAYARHVVLPVCRELARREPRGALPPGTTKLLIRHPACSPRRRAAGCASCWRSTRCCAA